MRGKVDIFFHVRWVVWAIWQGCQVKGQTIVEHSSLKRYYAFQALNFGFFSLATLRAKSL